MSKVLMYSRPRCGLCDEARSVIESVRVSAPFDFEEISIEGDDALEIEYGVRIPVVLIDGEEFAEYRVDSAARARAVAE
jgi:glutaredoxin